MAIVWPGNFKKDLLLKFVMYSGLPSFPLLKASFPDYTFVVSSREWLCRIGSIPLSARIASNAYSALLLLHMRGSLERTNQIFQALSLFNFLVAKMSGL